MPPGLTPGEAWQHVQHLLCEVTTVGERSAAGTSFLKPAGAAAYRGSLNIMKETKTENVDIVTSYFMCGCAGDPQRSSNLSSTAGKSIQETASNQHDIFVGREHQNSSISLTLITQ